MELLQGLEQVAQSLSGVYSRQDSLEQKLHELVKDHAKTSAQLDFMIKLLREQPAAPAGLPAATGTPPL